MIGKGKDPRHFPLSGLEEAKQWEYQSERFELLRQLGVDEVDGAAIGDAELVLRLYRAHGVDCVARLLGDFAFAIWDGALGRLLCDPGVRRDEA